MSRVTSRASGSLLSLSNSSSSSSSSSSLSRSSAPRLTENLLENIYKKFPDAAAIETLQKSYHAPVLQLISNNPDGLIILSDGLHSLAALAPPKLFEQFKVNSLVRILKFHLQTHPIVTLFIDQANFVMDEMNVIGAPRELKIESNIKYSNTANTNANAKPQTLNASTSITANSNPSRAPSVGLTPFTRATPESKAFTQDEKNSGGYTPQYTFTTVVPSHGSVIQANRSVPLTPLSALNCYNQRWAVKVRVVAKSEIIPYHNQNGAGRRMTFDIRDSDGSEMSVSAFNADLDKFSDIQLNGCYIISKGKLSIPDAKFKKSNQLNLRMIASSDTEINETPDDPDIPKESTALTRIHDIRKCIAGDNVDVCGVVHAIEDAQEVTTRTHQQTKRRTVTIADDSGDNGTACTIDLTLWGHAAELYPVSSLNQVVIIRTAKVSEFRGYTLSVNSIASIDLDPKSQRVKDLQRWYQQRRTQLEVQQEKLTSPIQRSISHIPRTTLTDVCDALQNLREDDRPEFVVLACIIFVQHSAEKPPFYWACATPECKFKKLLVQENGNQYLCERCGIATTTPSARYKLTLILQDSTASIRANAFSPGCDEIFGFPVEHMVELCRDPASGENHSPFSQIMSACTFQQRLFKINLRAAKLDPRAQEQQQAGRALPMATVQQVLSVDYVTESKSILAQILKEERERKIAVAKPRK